MVTRANDQLGPIDILVNNAALHKGGRIQNIDPKDWELVIRIALRGTFNCCRHVVPSMAERRWGRIINISSIAGVHGSFGDTAYGSTKTGLIGFTKSMLRKLNKRMSQPIFSYRGSYEQT